MRRSVQNVIKMMKVSTKDVILPDMKILNWEDAQAVVTMASGIVAGLKWKKALQKMMQEVESNDNVLSVCPVYSEATGDEWLLMVTDCDVVIATESEIYSFEYNEIEKYGQIKGIVSNHMVLSTNEYTFTFCWGYKDLARYTHNIIKGKLYNHHTIMEWGKIVTNS